MATAERQRSGGNQALPLESRTASTEWCPMFHVHVSPALQTHTLAEFAYLTSVIRVLVSAIAFGLGIEMPDIRRVIHWGPTLSMLALWHEFGRAGHDGKPAAATWYAHRKAEADVDRFQKRRLHDVCMSNGAGGIHPAREGHHQSAATGKLTSV